MFVLKSDNDEKDNAQFPSGCLWLWRLYKCKC